LDLKCGVSEQREELEKTWYLKANLSQLRDGIIYAGKFELSFNEQAMDRDTG
jgi:hypothetical protein